MKLKKKKIWIIAGIVLVLVVVVLNVTGKKSKGINVQAETVALKDITEEVSASGWVQPRTKVNITSEVSAEIIAVPVKEGQSVGRGQLLIQLDTVQLQKDAEQYRYSLNEMEARTSASKANFTQAEEEYTRQKQLFERKLTSETVVKSAEYAFLNGKFNYEAMLNQTNQGRAMYEKALDNLSKTRLTAPMDGVVTFVDAEVGEIAQAQTAFTQGRTLMTISNLAAFEAEVDVDETEITKIRLGQDARIEVDAFPDSIFQGEVMEIGNTAVRSNLGTTEQSTNFKVKILFKQSEADIRPGMSATVDIVTNLRRSVLTVPYGSIVMRSEDSLRNQNRLGDGSSAHAAPADSAAASAAAPEKKEKEKEIKGVFLVKDGQSKFMAVETGIADQKKIEILSGIAEGDTVITGPFRTLRTIRNGENVKVEKGPQSGKND